MPWIPFESRSVEHQQQITTVASGSSPELTPADLYNQNDLGLLADAELTSWLCQALAETSSSAPSAPEPEPLPELSESEAFDARSLRWLRLNGRTAADKAYAKQRYRQLLFELWRKHVAETGETYYPKLRNDLVNHFDLMTDPDRN